MIFKNSLKLFLASMFIVASTFNTSAQTWESMRSIPLQSLHHGVGFSFGTKGYIATGNQNITELGTKLFYEYDSETDTWTQKEDFPGPARSYAIGDFYDSTAYLGFGLVLDANGQTGTYHNDLWSYDPIKDEWKELASCPCAPRIHPAFVAHQGKIYVGLGNSGIEFNDWWSYDIETDKWTQMTDFPAEERHHPYQFAIGDYVYVGFGHQRPMNIFNDWYRYDPKLDKWEEMQSLPAEGRVAGTQFSHRGFGYVLSGDGDDHNEMETGEFWRYDPEINRWKQLPSHPKRSRWAPSSFVIDEHVYLISGLFTNDNGQDRMVRFNLEESLASTEEIIASEEEVVYPNPFDNVIKLSIPQSEVKEDFQLSIFNSEMKTIYSTDSFSESIELEDLPKGVYIINIINGNKSYTQRLLSL